jgi:hypothetical protein
MNLPSRDADTSENPRVVGFEAPSTGASKDGTPILQVLLDAPPSQAWREALRDESAAFASAHALVAIRVVGRSVNLIGPMKDPRHLAEEAKALVQRVSLLRSRQRAAGFLRDVGDGAIGAGSASGASAGDGLDATVRRDIEAVQRIGELSAVLDAAIRATRMRFAAVARVSESQWIACAVHDLIEFGLEPGNELVLETTICNEIRQHGHVVAIEKASEHATFASHPTPSMYGFESYISLPIRRTDGSFFGTLCALDPEPRRLDAETISKLEAFAELIGLQIEPDRPVAAPAS